MLYLGLEKSLAFLSAILAACWSHMKSTFDIGKLYNITVLAVTFIPVGYEYEYTPPGRALGDKGNK